MKQSISNSTPIVVQPQNSGTSGTTDVPTIAARFHLKPQTVNGQTEWHGPNPSGHGSAKDGFTLNADGTAWDRKLQRRYTSPEVAKLCGIAPEEYQPVAEFRAKSSRSEPPKKPSRLNWNSPQTVLHKYEDEDGDTLFEVGRTGTGESKQISQRRPDGKGGYTYSLQGVRRVLYRLPEVLAASHVLVCEGEKAVDAVRAVLGEVGLLGEYAATTNPHGAGKWQDAYNDSLAGKAVLIIPDNDEPGRNHGEAIAQGIAPLARETRVLELPGLPVKGDVEDYLRNGNHIAQLLELAEATPLWGGKEVEQTPPEDQAIPKFKFFSSSELKSRQAPSPLIDGVLFENTLAEIAGGHASFKSFIALDMAACVAAGIPWQNHQTRKSNVLYIAAEGAAGLKQRITAWELRHGQEMGVQFLPQAVQIHRSDDVEALVYALGQLDGKPGLIIVDTLARCFVGGEENSAKDAGTFIDGLDALRKATGATVLALHHVGKNGDTRGSTAFSGAFDTIIEAKRDNTTVTLRCLKQKDAAEFEPFSLIRRVQELAELDAYDRPLSSLIFELTEGPIELPSLDEVTQRAVLNVLKNHFGSDGANGREWQKVCEEANICRRARFYEILKTFTPSQVLCTDYGPGKSKRFRVSGAEK